MRPLLVPSLADDPVQKVLWGDRHAARLNGGRAIVELANDVIYLAIGVRNLGAGIALLHGWYPMPGRVFMDEGHADLDDFRRLRIDLYIPAGGPGYWESAIRDADDPVRAGFLQAITERSRSRWTCSTATNKAASARSAASRCCRPRPTTAGSAKRAGTGTSIVPIRASRYSARRTSATRNRATRCEGHSAKRFAITSASGTITIIATAATGGTFWSGTRSAMSRHAARPGAHRAGYR